MSENKKKKTIESKIDEINKLLVKFESGKLGIEDSMKEYEQATKKIQEIQDELEGIELKINEMIED